MDIKIENIDELISFYKKRKHENEYHLKIFDQVITMHTHIYKLQGLCKIIKEDGNLIRLMLKSDIINKFHPNIIENNKFWKLAKKNFPLFSVCGSEVKSVNECNEATLNMSKRSGLINFVNKYIDNNKNVTNIFEIGYGHGNLFFYLKENYNNINYMGIDFYKSKSLNQYKQLRIIKKSGIPKYIKNNSQDIIYSFNVFQHCSMIDRNLYLQQSYKKLKKDGFFLGGMLLETDENKESFCWGLQDENGRKYCHFLSQLTEVDTKEEFENNIKEIGFELVKLIRLTENYFSFILKK
jgi:hypothetical protein